MNGQAGETARGAEDEDPARQKDGRKDRRRRRTPLPGALRLRALEAEAGPLLRRAGLLTVLSGLIWPLQAWLIATTVAGWLAPDGTAATGGFEWAALAGFLALGLLRVLLDFRAGALLFRASDQVISARATALLARAARQVAAANSAATAALLAEKLPMLRPYLQRYRPAMLKVRVLPLVLAGLAFSQSWAVALILLVAGPLIPVFMALVGMAAAEASRRQLDEIATMNTLLMDRLAALADLRLLGAREQAAEDLAERAESLRARTMAVLRVAFLSSTVLELFAAIGVAMVAVYVGFSLLGVLGFGTWGSPMTLAQGMFMLLIAPEFFQPLRDLAAAWHDRATALAVAAELEAAEGREGPAILGRGDAVAPLEGALSLRLSGAVAGLAGGRVPLPDLEIRAGEAVALTGASGAGKSTCLRVLAGLVPLAEGRAEVCGRPLDDATADAWRARLAWMPQQPQFGDRPLSEILDPAATGRDPAPALRAAGADEVVARLPEGLETRLGETGGGVSGGEARRLMVARCLLSRGELVLADEPTADLDAVTARRVIAGLMQLRAEGRTLVVASHDPALVAAMDRAIVVGGAA